MIFMRPSTLPALLAVMGTLTLFAPPSAGAVIYPMPGWQANLSNIFHDVSGTVTILDSNSLVVENFTYDGQGIVVYFYLGLDDSQSSFESGLQIGPPLEGTFFDGSAPPRIIDLPGGETFEDFGAISVWCVDAKINFGSGSFTPVPEPSAPVLLSLGALTLLGARSRHRVRF
jgi:hypothetical protein